MGAAVREWLNGDESGKEMLIRVFRERPYLHLPPPFHKLPLRVGNVIELFGSSPSAKTHILMHSAISCILPLRYGGLALLLLFIDLDCRFDVLRFSHLLRFRIAQMNHDEADEEMLLGECMRRFLYIRCYDSLQFLATLKTIHYQLQRESEAQGITVSCMMIDSIGAFHWNDRASTSFHHGDSRKGLSLQNIWETVVLEIKKLMLVHPMLVIAAKGTIFRNQSATTKIGWNLKGPSVSSVPTNMKQFVHREYMPSVWQMIIIILRETVYIRQNGYFHHRVLWITLL
ncbi:DNA repair protein XRCC2 homolog isoform X2 [Mercurialis annua]|uniref:DNA repair protein XRCC2 homolog isoform X2 n=1 Tax=Mercurialis annua TaxID=3986 RepID=UPI00215E53D3|nr:DNA repair protein XRCC2 homolog isoform X2 [Mercurialis annua]